MLSYKIHRNIFLFGTALLVIGMPVSVFILSIAQIILLANWILEGNFKKKICILQTRKAILLLVSIYLIHLLWVFNTDNFFNTLVGLRLLFVKFNFSEIFSNINELSLPPNFRYFFHDIRIKLPILVLPIIYGTSDILSKKEFKVILLLFISTVLVNTFITSYLLLGFSNIIITDPRNASLFLSHIRFSLMIDLCIFIMLYIVYSNQFKLYKWEKVILIILVLWLFSFLILLKSFTGIVIFFIVLPLAIIWIGYLQKNKRLVRISYISSFIIVLATLAYLLFSYNKYYERHDGKNTALKNLTNNGNLYTHDIKSTEYENGYKVWINLCEKELAEEWNLKSTFDYDSVDRKGQPLRTTLIRYLTSLGYTKDSVGISMLDEGDLEMVENGYTNFLYKNKFSLYPRIYEVLWELDRYNKGADPSGYSMAQRIEFLKTGIHIIKNNFWLGTGTGDVDEEFQKQYIKDESKLWQEFRYRTHNQFITLFIAFGFPGFLWIIFALFYAPVPEDRYNNLLFFTFLVIVVLSMLNEDTLETHVGVSFFAFFYSFFLFSMPLNESIE